MQSDIFMRKIPLDVYISQMLNWGITEKIVSISTANSWKNHHVLPLCQAPFTTS